jgi:hypothetical protein
VLGRADQLLVAGSGGGVQSAAAEGPRPALESVQFSASYALQNSKSILDITQNVADYLATDASDSPRHNLKLSGLVDLPWRFQVSLLSTFLSRPPVAPTINGYDNTGTNAVSGANTRCWPCSCAATPISSARASWRISSASTTTRLRERSPRPVRRRVRGTAIFADYVALGLPAG